MVMISRRPSSTPTTYYKKEFKAARKNGESGWAVINDRLRYERHIAAVICRENSCMLGSTLDARCRARAIQRSLCTAAVPGTGSG